MNTISAAMDGALTFVSEGDRKTGRPATYPLLWPRPDKPAARFYTVSGRVEDTARGEGVGSFVRNWSLSMRLLSVAPYLSEAWPMLRPFTPPGNTCNLANSKGFSYSITFLSTVGREERERWLHSFRRDRGNIWRIKVFFRILNQESSWTRQRKRIR